MSPPSENGERGQPLRDTARAQQPILRRDEDLLGSSPRIGKRVIRASLDCEPHPGWVAEPRSRVGRVRTRLCAGGKWIRTVGPTCGRRSLCGERDGNNGSSTGPAGDCRSAYKDIRLMGRRSPLRYSDYAYRRDRRVSRGGFPSARRRARGSQRHSSFSARAKPPRSRRRGSRCHWVACLPVDLPPAHRFAGGGHHPRPCRTPRWVKEVPRGRPIAVYSICGFQVSGRAVAELRQPGYDAGALLGGINACHAIGGTTVPLDISTYEEAP
jgi:hypothetical protein